MQDPLKKFRDRLRITIILYTFSIPLERKHAVIYSEFRTEVKIQALDFLLRYPDFLASELMDLMSTSPLLDADEIKAIVQDIYNKEEPQIRTEEMEKFFHGAYESIDEVVAYLIAIGFIKYESKRRSNGKEYEKHYWLTHYGREKIEANLKSIPLVEWYFNRCSLIKKYFEYFSGTELKDRQYRYRDEYARIPYRTKIKTLNEKVKKQFAETFNQELV